jgi:hypothetical protein
VHLHTTEQLLALQGHSGGSGCSVRALTPPRFLGRGGGGRHFVVYSRSGKRAHPGRPFLAYRETVLNGSGTPTAPSPSIACPYAGLRGTERGGRGIPLPPATGPQPWAVRSEDSFAVLRTVRSCRTLQHPDGNAWCC